MRAILWDEKGLRIVSLDPEDTLGSMYQLMGVQLVEAVGKPDADTAAWADEEGLYNPRGVAFDADWFPGFIAGPLLITGIDDSGETVATDMSLNAVAARVKGYRVLTRK